MLSYNKIIPLKIIPVLLLLVTFSLTGCGFTPVYGSKSSHNSPLPKEALDTVKIERSNLTRNHQELFTELEDIFNPDKSNTKQKYLLKTSLKIDKGSQAIRQTGEITRYTLVATTDYALVEIGTGKTIYNNTSKMRSSFDAVGSDFGTFTAEEDTKSRLVREIANDIAMHVATYFNNMKKPIDKSDDLKKTGKASDKKK